MVNTQRTLRSAIKAIILSVIVGALLTCASILIVGKRVYFSGCDYTGKNLHVLDRGAPLTYFKVTPSESVCDPVDNVGAVWSINVGNNVSFKALFADWFIWSGISAITILTIQKIRASKNTASHILVDDLK